LVYDQSKLAELLIRIAGGDDTALNRVYETESGKLNALLIRILRDEQIAEEVLQDVFLTVWKSSRSFDPARGAPMTWLVTIARNKAIDRLRTERPRRGSTVQLDEEVLPSLDPGLTQQIEQRQQQKQLSDCLNRLEPKQQAAIRTAFFEGLTYEALALQSGVPLGTLRSTIRRGLLRLRACLER